MSMMDKYRTARNLAEGNNEALSFMTTNLQELQTAIISLMYQNVHESDRPTGNLFRSVPPLIQVDIASESLTYCEAQHHPSW